jgi:hypothetical protein
MLYTHVNHFGYYEDSRPGYELAIGAEIVSLKIHSHKLDLWWAVAKLSGPSFRCGYCRPFAASPRGGLPFFSRPADWRPRCTFKQETLMLFISQSITDINAARLHPNVDENYPYSSSYNGSRQNRFPPFRLLFQSLIQEAVRLSFHRVRKTMSSRKDDGTEAIRHACPIIRPLCICNQTAHSVDWEQRVAFASSN